MGNPTMGANRAVARAGLMIPWQTHANGLPWLIWYADRRWECRGCGESGLQHPYSSVPDFARWAGEVKRAHARCGHPITLGAGEIGHPLNPDRRER